MLQRIRHHRHLGTTVLVAFALAWLAALLANMPLRMALAQLQPHGTCMGAAAHEHAPGPHTTQHADPSCVLCLALGTPPADAPPMVRAPLPQADPARAPLAAPARAWRALAALPARGPPQQIHT